MRKRCIKSGRGRTGAFLPFLSNTNYQTRRKECLWLCRVQRTSVQGGSKKDGGDKKLYLISFIHTYVHYMLIADPNPGALPRRKSFGFTPFVANNTAQWYKYKYIHSMYNEKQNTFNRQNKIPYSYSHPRSHLSTNPIHTVTVGEEKV